MPTLPLFPLNTVLFPSTPLTLHIFEERYKMMIGECIRARQPFGVVLLRSGSEVLNVGTEPVLYTVGCTARIIQSQPLDGGRMNIVAVGQDRFTVTDFDRALPYLVGQIEPYPLPNPEPAALAEIVNRMRPWIHRYLTILDKTEHVRINPRQLPQNDVELTYLAASLLKINIHIKQELLMSPSAVKLAANVHRLYRKEVTLSEMLLGQPELAHQGPFSAN
jgi:Lon protease-like protein